MHLGCKRNEVSHTAMTTPTICTTDLLDIRSYWHDKRACRAPCRWTRHKCTNKLVESCTHSGVRRDGGQICTCTVKQGWAELKAANLQYVQPTHAPTRGEPDVSRAQKMQCLVLEPTSGHCEGYARRERLTQQRVRRARNTSTALCTDWEGARSERRRTQRGRGVLLCEGEVCFCVKTQGVLLCECTYTCLRIYRVQWRTTREWLWKEYVLGKCLFVMLVRTTFWA